MAVTLDLEKSEPLKLAKFKTKDVEKGFARLDPNLQKLASNIPATITSTFRDPYSNAAVGGVPGSYHTKGQALDYRLGELSPEDQQKFIQKGYQIIPESDHLHIEPGPKFKAKKESPVTLDLSKSEAFQNEEDPMKGMIKQEREKPLLQKFKENPLTGFVTGIGRSVPGSDLAAAAFEKIHPLGAVTSGIMDLVTGESTPQTLDPQEFLRRYKQAQKIGKDIQKASPISYTAGTITGSIPQFAAGSSALGGIGKGVSFGKNLLKSGLLSGLQGQGQRGFEVDPLQTAIDVGGGMVGAAIPYAVKGVGAVKGKSADALKGLLKTSKFPQRLYGQATGLADTIKESPEVIETLLRKGVAPKTFQPIDVLENVAGTEKKAIGQGIEKALEGKIIPGEELLSRLPSPSSIAQTAAPGVKGTTEKASKKVLEELQGDLINKITEEIPGGVMLAPEGYSKNLINLPSKITEKISPIPLKDINLQKSLLAEEASKIYAGTAKGSAKQKAQKEVADLFRKIVEEKSPEMRELNKAYNIYKQLGEGVKDVTSKDFRKVPLFEGSPFKSKFEPLLGLTKGQKARNAIRLFNLMNKPTSYGIGPSLFGLSAGATLGRELTPDFNQ